MSTTIYLAEGKRSEGKSRLVKQQYLGRAEQVVARLEGQTPEPTRVRVAEYGGSQGLLSMARRLHLVEILGRAEARPRIIRGGLHAVSSIESGVGAM